MQRPLAPISSLRLFQGGSRRPPRIDPTRENPGSLQQAPGFFYARLVDLPLFDNLDSQYLAGSSQGPVLVEATRALQGVPRLRSASNGRVSPSEGATLFAGLADRLGIGLPSRTDGFDSRGPLHFSPSPVFWGRLERMGESVHLPGCNPGASGIAGSSPALSTRSVPL